MLFTNSLMFVLISLFKLEILCKKKQVLFCSFLCAKCQYSAKSTFAGQSLLGTVPSDYVYSLWPWKKVSVDLSGK